MEGKTGPKNVYFQKHALSKTVTFKVDIFILFLQFEVHVWVAPISKCKCMFVTLELFMVEDKLGSILTSNSEALGEII